MKRSPARKLGSRWPGNLLWFLTMLTAGLPFTAMGGQVGVPINLEKLLMNHPPKQDRQEPAMEVEAAVGPKEDRSGGRAGRNKARKIDEVVVETTNTTGWSALKVRLIASKADVICAEEHHTPDHLVDERSAWAAKNGWKSAWSPAKVTDPSAPFDARNTSGGVAVFVRKYLGLGKLAEDKEPEIVPGRVVGVKVTAPGMGVVAVYSAYLVTGVGLNGENRNILHAIADSARGHGLAWLVGADWNMQPNELAGAAVVSKLRAKIIAPEDDTCIAPACVRTIDYFLISDSLADAMKAPVTVDDAETRPHKPVITAIRAGLKAARKKVFRQVKNLPTEPLIGPVRRPPSFEVPKRLAAEAMVAFAGKNDELGFAKYDAAFAAFAARAEIMVANANDLPAPESRSRVERPGRIEAPLVPEVSRNQGLPRKAGALSNLLQRAQNVSAHLLQAWRFGEHHWAKLSSCCRKALSACRDVGRGLEEEPIASFEAMCEAAAGLATEALEAERGADGYQSLWARYAGCASTAAAIRKDLTDKFKSEKQAAQDLANEEWGGWKAKGLQGSARGAHRFAKTPVRWAPPEVFDGDGNRALGSPSILKVGEAKYRKLWKAGSQGLKSGMRATSRGRSSSLRSFVDWPGASRRRQVSPRMGGTPATSRCSATTPWKRWRASTRSSS